MISKEEFIKKCDLLIPKEEATKWTKSRNKVWIAWLITWAVAVIVLLSLQGLGSYIPFIIIASALILMLIEYFIFRYRWRDFKKQHSNIAFDCLLEGYKYKFQPDYCIGQAIFRSSGFAGSFDSYSGEDLLNVNIPQDDGTPSNVTLNICDLNVTREETRTNSEGETETVTVTVYDGVFGYIYFPFDFKCNISLNIAFKREKRIKLEDVNFNRRFKTYTDSHLDALVILTPTLMQKLVSFSKRVRGLKISLTKSGSLYFGMKKDLFKLKKIRPSGKVFEGYYDDVAIILSMVNEIKDSNKVFKM